MPAALVRHSRRKMRSKVESEQRERFAKIGDYVMEWLGHLGIARSDADKQTDAGRSAGFDVAYLIAEDRAVSGIEPEIGDGLRQHSRLGFAPRVIATVFTDAWATIIGDNVHRTRKLQWSLVGHCRRQLLANVQLAWRNWCGNLFACSPEAMFLVKWSTLEIALRFRSRVKD